ncbi:MAG: pseudouridine-5'-phosphate glycosidase [Paracoccaceae bacterium]|jgi:pseudouridine-5'-phosphate glycosidase
MQLESFLIFAPEVLSARAQGIPIVALESTIITHGMPFPQNQHMAQTVEQDLRVIGVCPATIAVMGGKIHIGLTPQELENLAKTNNVDKLSRADLGVCLAHGTTGATTVSATMICSALAGIKVFATGGIGGVHRGASKSFDISADLREFTISPVTVICAGAKAILDLPKTFELLETYGVPVIAFGQDEVPAFWSRASGLRAPLRLDRPEDIARAHNLRAELGLQGGQLIVNPIPFADEIPRAEIEPAILLALAEAKKKNILAKEVTPFLLDKIYQITQGRSLHANIALMRNNALLAGQIALALGAEDFH